MQPFRPNTIRNSKKYTILPINSNSRDSNNEKTKRTYLPGLPMLMYITVYTDTTNLTA